MFLIEPCCSQRQLRELRQALTKTGTAQFEGYGDLSLAELLDALLPRYNETEMTIVAPSLPGQAAEAIDRWMRKAWARMDGKGVMFVIRHLTVIARLEKESSRHIAEWLEKEPYGDRLTLIDAEQEDTAILLPDFAITGPVNMRYGHRFTADATMEKDRLEMLWKKYTAIPDETAAVAEEEDAADTVEDTEAEEYEENAEAEDTVGEQQKIPRKRHRNKRTIQP